MRFLASYLWLESNRRITRVHFEPGLLTSSDQHRQASPDPTSHMPNSHPRHGGGYPSWYRFENVGNPSSVDGGGAHSERTDQRWRKRQRTMGTLDAEDCRQGGNNGNAGNYTMKARDIILLSLCVIAYPSLMGFELARYHPSCAAASKSFCPRCLVNFGTGTLYSSQQIHAMLDTLSASGTKQLSKAPGRQPVLVSDTHYRCQSSETLRSGQTG
jgi:hypothetical protein